MKETTIDLSDNIFIHKRFVEVVEVEFTNKKTLLEYLEGFIWEDIKVKIKVSVWNGTVLEEDFVEVVRLCLLIVDKRVVGLGWNTYTKMYYNCTKAHKLVHKMIFDGGNLKEMSLYMIIRRTTIKNIKKGIKWKEI